MIFLSQECKLFELYIIIVNFITKVLRRISNVIVYLCNVTKHISEKKLSDEFFTTEFKLFESIHFTDGNYSSVASREWPAICSSSEVHIFRLVREAYFW